MNDYVDWLKKNKITEVECMIPDNSGIPRGKILPTKKFLSSIESGGLRLPLALFKLAVSRDVTYSIDDQILNPTDGDFILKPDFNTLRTVPWYEEPTAQVICDAVDNNDNVIEVHSRGILKKVIGLYEKIGLEPVVAPEIEFYLVKKNNDPDNPLETPSGQSGRIEKGKKQTENKTPRQKVTRFYFYFLRTPPQNKFRIGGTPRLRLFRTRVWTF